MKKSCVKLSRMSRTINLGKESTTMGKPKFDHCLFKGQTEISAQKCYVFVYVIYIGCKGWNTLPDRSPGVTYVVTNFCHCNKLLKFKQIWFCLIYRNNKIQSQGQRFSLIFSSTCTVICCCDLLLFRRSSWLPECVAATCHLLCSSPSWI